MIFEPVRQIVITPAAKLNISPRPPAIDRLWLPLMYFMASYALNLNADKDPEHQYNRRCLSMELSKIRGICNIPRIKIISDHC